jgi:hypothetical protein
MCKYFNKCNKTCKSYKSHFRHWEHIRKYTEKKDSSFLNYRTYTRLSKNIQKDIMNERNMVQNKEHNLINYDKYEKYLVKNMVEKMIYDIVDKI